MADSFEVQGGQQVHTLSELIASIDAMDPQTFAHHCNEYKNDFAAWVRIVLREDQLAAILEETRTRESALSVLRTYARLHDQTGSREPAQEANQKRFVFHKKPVQEAAAQPPVQPHEPIHAQEPYPESGSMNTSQVDAALEEATNPQSAQNAPLAQDPATQPQEPVDPDEPYEPHDVQETSGMTEKTASGEVILTEEVVKQYSETLHAMRSEINKVFIGQEEIVDQVLLCLMCDSHSLLEGVPGLAKSLLVETLTHVVDGTSFHRIQFIPDLLPSDVIGGQIYNPKTQEFTVVKGPIFANFVLADEINRAPPKTHAAVMEAMQEKKINIDKEEFDLDPPFLIIATQNPLENKGTYELPEAVLDRFMFKLDLDYPSRKDEKTIITENATTKKYEKKAVAKVVTKERFLEMQRNVKNVYLSERIRDYILDLVEATRGVNKSIEGAQFIKYGAGPRASIYLGVGAKARAIMQGRNYVLPDDVNFVAKPILRHRVALNFKGKAHGIKSDRIVDEILHKVTTL